MPRFLFLFVHIATSQQSTCERFRPNIMQPTLSRGSLKRTKQVRMSSLEFMFSVSRPTDKCFTAERQASGDRQTRVRRTRYDTAKAERCKENGLQIQSRALQGKCKPCPNTCICKVARTSRPGDLFTSRMF